jgi:hypothetical protein
MRNKHQQRFWSFMILVTLAAGAGCSKTSSLSDVPGFSYLTIINEAPYGSVVDIYLNGTLVSPSGGIAPGRYSKEYGSLKPGVYTVDFKKTGTDSLLFEIPASSFDIRKFYSLLLFNGAPGSATVQAVKVMDDFSAITTGGTYYRFFNLSPDVPAVDLYLNNSIAQLQRTPADNVDDPMYDEFQPVNPAVYSLQVKVSATDSVLATQNAISLVAGSVYTVFLSGTDRSANNLKISVLQASF